MGGKNKDAASDAAEIQARAQQLAIAEQRRQFGITERNLAPFVEAGTGALPGVIQGTTAQGLGERLSEIFNTDAFASLRDERERSVRGQLGAAGLSRSGTALETIADIPTNLGLALENLLTGRSTNLAGSGQNAAARLGALGAQSSGNISNLLAAQGATRASGVLGDAQAGAQGISNVLGGIGGIASFFGPGRILKGLGAVGSFFSDPRLKENVERISTIGDLGVYEWDWIDGAKGTMIEKCGTIGFIADEVEEKYPHHVGEFGGFAVINYPALLNELECKNNAQFEAASVN